MKEKEIRGFINTKEEFEEMLKNMSEKFGEAKYAKRLSLTLGDYKTFDIETKIRITNGKISITQKLGDQNAVSRDENEINGLNANSQELKQLYRMFETFTKRSTNNFYAVAIQHENYIFLKDNFEIKLFRQYNHEAEFFAFEVEEFGEDEVSIEDFTSNLGLAVDGNYNTENVVKHRNATYNIDLTDVDDRKIMFLLDEYLND